MDELDGIDLIYGHTPVAVITGPRGDAEIFEYLSDRIVEYRVQMDHDVQKFNSLGSAYLAAEELVGKR